MLLCASARRLLERLNRPERLSKVQWKKSSHSLAPAQMSRAGSKAAFGQGWGGAVDKLIQNC